MSKRMLVIIMLLSTLLTGGSSAQATSEGLHFDTFNCVSAAAPSESGSLDVQYTVGRLGDGTWWLRFEEGIWNTSPHRNLNALKFKLENSPGNYVTISPSWGGGSSTHDDVPSSFTQSRDTVPWPTGTTGDYKWWFVNTGNPTLKLDCWGMGPGNTPSDSAHNDSSVRPIE